jgi:sugar (pentulose or hexulose) kinase
MKPTITVDIGTTRLKLCLFDGDGLLRSASKSATPTAVDEWGPIYDVDALVAAVSGFITELDHEARRAVRTIAIAGVGESGGLVGSAGQLYSPMILWHDHRGAGLLDRLGDDDRLLVYRTTGLPVNPNYALSKVAWAVAHAGRGTEDAKWMNVSEFLAAKLTGRRWAEYSLASRTMALDLRTREWSSAMCALFGLDTGIFPELHPASHGEPVRAEFARQVGLDPSAEVHVVGHDHMVGGAGADLYQGEVLNSTGTTEGLLLLRDRPVLDERAANTKLANGLACDGRTSTLFASIPTGGSAYRTLQRMVGISASALDRCVADLAARHVSGEIDLDEIPIVIPHFRGSPPPEKSASARGVIANLSSDVRAEDIVYGCFLGMATDFGKVLELFPDTPSVIKVIGPAAGNPLWLHLKADLLNIDLNVSDVDEVVSRGAQALASGERSDWMACRPRAVVANPQRHDQLRDWHARVKPTLERLASYSW